MFIWLNRATRVLSVLSQQQLILAKHLAIASQTYNKNKLVTHSEDADVFGTLSKSYDTCASNSDLLFDTWKDAGDEKEDKYLSFTPTSRKSVRKYEEEIISLIENRKLKQALHLMEVEMKEEKIKPDKNIYSRLIGACGRTGYTKKAFRLYNDMKKRALVPSSSTYTALFNACANSPWPSDGLQRAKKLRQQLLEKNYTFNRLQYNSIIKAFGRCGDLPTAFDVLKEMKSNNIVADTETYNFLLQACASLQHEGFQQALKIWYTMRKENVKPDIYSYNLMLRIVRDCGAKLEGNDDTIAPKYLLGEKDLNPQSTLDVVKQCTDVITVQNETGTSTKLNLLTGKLVCDGIIAFQNLNQPDNRLALLGGITGFLGEMKQNGVKPDIKTFTQLLETISSTENEEKVLMDWMEQFGLNPDVDFFNLLIKKRNFRKDYRGASEVLTLMQKYKLHPNIMTFGVLALGRHSWEEAEILIRDLEDAGFRVNNEIFGSLLTNAIYSRNIWYVIQLMNRAVEMNLALNERCMEKLERFREETMENMAKYDRGELKDACYGKGQFRRRFRLFCFNYKRWLEKLGVDLEPHPWQQYRYKLE